jgi:predicted O-methyltransferase YrrM
VSEETWSAVDDYIVQALLPFDPVLDEAVRHSVEAGLPPIQVSAPQGKQLMLLARAIGAQRVLEVGTLGGYSTIWLARGLPLEGHVDTLEIDPLHAEVARANIASAGLSDHVVVHLGRGVDTLTRLVDEGVPAYDLVFVDADKESNTDYVRLALDVSHPGTLIIIDNVIRDGQVADASNTKSAVLGVRRLNDYLAAEPRLDATSIQTVGHKGYDGFTLAVVAEA